MNLNGILIGSEDPGGLVAYYTRLFGEPGWAGGDFRGWQLGTGYVTVGPHDQVQGRNPQPGRLVWNLETPDVHGEFERLKAAGATVVREPYQPGEAPEGWIAEQTTHRAPRGVRREGGADGDADAGQLVVGDDDPGQGPGWHPAVL